MYQKVVVFVVNTVIIYKTLFQFEDEEAESDVEYVMEDELEEELSDLEVCMQLYIDNCSILLNISWKQ